MINLDKISEFEIDGVDGSDYPDFSDAHITYAVWDTGVEFTEKELDSLNEDFPEFVHEKAYAKWMYC